MNDTGGPLSRCPVAVSTFRAQVTKTGATKYMSHLDFIGTIEKSVRRAGLPVLLSAGFNPRPKMSFSPALPVGISSNSEYVDIVLREHTNPDEISSKLNDSLPQGMEIVSGEMLPPNVPALSALIEAACYGIKFTSFKKTRLDCLLTAVSEILKKDSIIIRRTTPKGIRRIDIRPLIYEMHGAMYDLTVVVRAIVSIGSKGNVRPFDLAKVIVESGGMEESDVFVNINRERLYRFCDDKLCLPWNTRS